MKLPRGLSGRELASSLANLGYRVVRQTGSHIRLETESPGKHSVTVPDHDPIKTGTLSSILRDVAGHHRLTRDELLVLLFG